VGEASGRGLSGWVRNRADGSVEAVFAGPEADVQAMVAACRRGPPAARVDHIEQAMETAVVEPGFLQRPDC
jgi:acylphosphatase